MRQAFDRALRTHGRSFSRANLTALAATSVDFGTLVALVELGGVFYVTATACGAIGGGITNFLLNKYWAFEHRHGSTAAQSVRYTLVSGASLVLNTSLVFCLTEFGGLMYLKSKVITALAVGWFWNYPLHRYFVFPPQRQEDRH